MTAPNLSVDRAVMEKTSKAAVQAGATLDHGTRCGASRRMITPAVLTTWLRRLAR
jgi:hypothetical protein